MIGNLLSFLCLCATTGLSVYFLSKVIKYVVLFSKIAFAVICAAALCQFVSLVDANIFLNFVVWLLPCLGLCFLLNLFPRINFAITFLLNILIITVIGTGVIQGILPKIGVYSMNKYLLLAIYLVSAVVSFRVLMDQVKVKKDLKFLVVRVFDRLMASALNTVSLFYIILQTVNFPDNIPLFIAAVCVSFVLFYLADIYLFKLISPLATGRKMPSEVRHILNADWGKLKDISLFDVDSYKIDNDSRSYDAYDEQQRQHNRLMESMWAAQREQEEYDRIQRETDDAIRFYNENY